MMRRQREMTGYVLLRIRYSSSDDGGWRTTGLGQGVVTRIEIFTFLLGGTSV